MSSQPWVVDTARNLGVVVDSQLSMSAQVAAVCRGSYYQLRQLRPLKRRITDETIKTLTHVFINSRLDYCINVLYCGIAEGLLSRLQSVQNAAACLVTGLERREHITPVLLRLQWHLQFSDAGLPLACRNRTGLHVRRVSSYIICLSALSALS